MLASWTRLPGCYKRCSYFHLPQNVGCMLVLGLHQQASAGDTEAYSWCTLYRHIMLGSLVCSRLCHKLAAQHRCSHHPRCKVIAA